MLLRTLKKPFAFPLCRLTPFPSVRPISFHSTFPRLLSPRLYSSSSSSSRVNPSAAGTSAPLPFVAVVNIPETELAHNAFFALHRPLLGLENEERSFFGNAGGAGAYYGGERGGVEDEVDMITHYFSTLRPYEPPATTISLIFHRASQESSTDVVAQFLDAVSTGLMEQEEEREEEKKEEPGQEDAGRAAEGLHATSVLRKRKLKMNKHKYNKLRKRTRALRKKIDK